MRVAILVLALIGCGYWAFGGPAGSTDPDDRAVVTYFTNGQMRTRTSYKDGVRHGPHQAWYADGTPRVEGRFEGGRREGPWTAWNEDGTRDEDESATYRSGKRLEG